MQKPYSNYDYRAPTHRKFNTNKMARVRKSHGLLLKDVAETLGCSVTWASKIERGEMVPVSLEEREALMRVYKVDCWEEIDSWAELRRYNRQPLPVVVVSDEDMPRMIRTRRLELGMKQSELAERLGKSQKYISTVESGIRTAQPSDLKKLKSVLKIEE